MSLNLLPAPETRALTTTPTKMNFQGRLTNSSGTTMPDGLYNMKFRLFTVASGGSDVWNETRETTNRVQVTNGLFSVQLGAVTPISASLFASGSLYFEVELPTPATATCGTASCQTWTEGPMTTRSILSTSAYAFNSETLDGLDSTGFIQNQDSSVQTAAKLWIGGTARVDTSILAPLLDTATATTLEIGTTNATSISLKKDTTLAAGKSLTLVGGAYGTRPASPTPGMLYYDTTSNQLLQYNGTKWISDRSTSTKIVAASNASQTLKDGADYVVAGNAEDEINAALTAAAGGKVYLTEGTYVAGATISIPNNTTLAGAGNGTIIELADLDADDNLIENTDQATGTGIAIRDLTISGRKDLNTAGVQYGIYLNNMGDGTGPTATTGATITDITVTSFRSDGLRLNSSNNNTITNGTYIKNDWVGVRSLQSIGNRISNNLAQSNYSVGIQLADYSTGNVVTGNTVRDNDNWAGIYVTDNSSNNIVTSNTLTDNGFIGIYVNANANDVRSNTLDASGITLYIYGNNNNISENSMSNSGSATDNGAIYVYGDSNSIIGNSITDSSATSTNIAIEINNAASSSNYLADNIFSSTPGTSTIADTGTGTTYANQPTAENGMNLLNRTLNSTTAFSIQGTNKVNVLNVDTTNGELELGSYNSGSNPLAGKLLMANAVNANTITLQTGTTAASYTLTLPTAVGASGDCLKTSDASGTLTFGSCAAGGGVTSVGAFSGTSIANGASIAGTVITFGPADASNPGMVTTGAQTLAGVKTFNDSLILATAKTISMTGGTTVTRNGLTPSEGMIYYDTDTKRLVTYSNGKWQADRTDAVLVAANNSSQADKDAADYVADGTDDQVQINAALTAADPASGTRKTGKVFLFAGTYTTHRTDNGDATIKIPNNTTLAGAGRSTLIQLGDIDVTDNLVENSDASTGTGVIIQDLRLDGQNSANTAGTQNAIYFSGMGDSTATRKGGVITNVVIENFRTNGIYLNDADRNVLTNINSYNNSNYAIYMLTATDNRISDSTLNAMGGFYIESSTYNVISSNTVFSGFYGIYTTTATNNTFSSNTLQNNSVSGFRLTSASNSNILSSNTIKDSGSTTDNNGIYVESGSSNNIVDNYITDSSCGTGTANCRAIRLQSGSNNYLSNNFFSDTDADATANIQDATLTNNLSNQATSVDGASATYRSANSATVFQVQNASSANVLTVDTSAGEVELGSAALAGKLVISDGANSTVTISLNTITGDNNYTLAIPAVAGNDTICVQSVANCVGSLSTSYAADADGGDAIIALTTTDGGIRLQDAATPLTTAFSVENNGGTAKYFSVSSAGVAMNDGSSRPTFLMDNTTHELRVYENVASSPRYAVMYYDTANNMAVFGASSGATQIGTAGVGGDINLSLSGAAADKLTASKTFNLAGAYSGNDFTFKRNLTGTSYAMTGNVMVVEDSSGFTGGSSSPNLLYINQGNAGATGNLILSQTGGSVDKFKVDVSGNVTAAGTVTGTSYTATTGGVSIASGASYTGAGAVTVSSASGTNLTLLAQGAGKVITKPGTDSASSFEVQDSAGVSLLLANTTDDRIIVGVSDTVGTTLVLDTKTGAGNPTGVDGAMYYNSDEKSFRCYKNGLWGDCSFSSLRSEWVFQEDFAGGLTTTGNVGDNSWIFTAVGTGAVTYLSVGADASNYGRFGVLQFASTTTNPSGISVRQNAATMAGVPSNMVVEFDFAPVNATAAAALQQIHRIGLHNSTGAAAPTNGLYFQYVATTTAGNWFRCTQATCVDTGVARTTTANQYQRFRIQTNSAGTSVEFFINEASVGTVSTNLPGATAVYTPAYNTSGTNTTARTWKTDYFQIKRNLTTLR